MTFDSILFNMEDNSSIIRIQLKVQFSIDMTGYYYKIILQFILFRYFNKYHKFITFIVSK